MWYSWVLRTAWNALKPELQLSYYDFELPESLIARQPLPQRDASRLLQVHGEQLFDRCMRDLPALVRTGDLWVLNNTRVIPARLHGRKASGGRVELLLLEKTDSEDVWLAWGKANKPINVGTWIHIADGFEAEVLAREGRTLRLHLHADDVAAAIERHGHMPLPPYMQRDDTAEDQERYQTVFARHAGAVAAPTAGLHLTEALMQAMRQAGASFTEVTLHVGPGTFQPVDVEHIPEHRMHEEVWHVDEQAAERINQARQQGQRIVAVGTTSLRCLESAAIITDDGVRLRAGSGRSRLFIYPGYEFRLVDALLTNFHLPRSTLLMLVAALIGGERVHAAYAHAIARQYRFFSYGDAMFCQRATASVDH